MSWRRFFRRTSADLDHAAEFHAHLLILTDENIARGMQPDEARWAAQRKLGNLTSIREEVYQMNSLGFLETLGQDLHYAARTLRKNPGFSATAIITLALGLGANSAIFSLVDAVLLKPLPYPDPDRLVILFEKPPVGQRNSVAPGNFLDWRESSKTIAMAALSGESLTMTGQGEPIFVNARIVSPNYFEIIGSTAATGRTFLPEEGVPGRDKVLLVAHRFWQQRLGSDPNVLGRSLMLNGTPYKIIGTLPPDSWFDRHPADVWMPMAANRANASREFHYLAVYGRLRGGVTRAAAQAEMDAISLRMAQDSPATNRGVGVTIDPLVDRIVSPQLRQSLHVLFWAVAAVLLIACVNLANLLLARSAARERELWVRLSLGAGRARLVRQFLTESLLLSLLGGIFGCGLGYALLKGLLAWMPAGSLPTQADVRLDLRVLAYLFATTIVSGLLFGLAPAFATWRKDAARGLNEGARGSSGSASAQRLRYSLIVAEVALCFVLVATAGVLIHSFMRLTGVDPGVQMSSVLTMALPRAMQKDTDGVRETAIMNRIADSVRTLPGVSDVALTSGMPLQGWGFGMLFKIQGRSAANGKARDNCGFKMIGPSYFRVLGMKLLSGRSLAETDRSGTTPVAVINQAMAQRHFKDENPIGQHVLIQKIITGKREVGPEIPWEIVGVVSDEKTNGLSNDASPGAYVTFDQSPIVGMGLVARVKGDPMHMVKAFQSAIWSVNRDQAITEVQPLEEIKTQSTATNRFNMLLLTGFALLALILAAVGIYGVVAYSVAQRTREMGIRAALGASSGSLLRLALRNSLLLAALGLAVGAVGIHWSSRLIATLLFQTEPAELQTVVVVGIVLASVALLASAIPARRAARIDPMVALRHD